MRSLAFLLWVGWLLAAATGWADETTYRARSGEGRIESRYCTIHLEPGIDAGKLNKKVSVRGVSRLKLPRGASPETELAAKCDILFERAEELLDMFPPGMHVLLKVVSDRGTIATAHETQYGSATDAIAIYLFESNTIYAWGKEISESVLIHEMAHAILDHYFQVRPPRKIEELLAMHVDAQMRE